MSDRGELLGGRRSEKPGRCIELADHFNADQVRTLDISRSRVESFLIGEREPATRGGPTYMLGELGQRGVLSYSATRIDDEMNPIAFFLQRGNGFRLGASTGPMKHDGLDIFASSAESVGGFRVRKPRGSAQAA